MMMVSGCVMLRMLVMMCSVVPMLLLRVMLMCTGRVSVSDADVVGVVDVVAVCVDDEAGVDVVGADVDVVDDVVDVCGDDVVADDVDDEDGGAGVGAAVCVVDCVVAACGVVCCVVVATAGVVADPVVVDAADVYAGIGVYVVWFVAPREFHSELHNRSWYRGSRVKESKNARAENCSTVTKLAERRSRSEAGTRSTGPPRHAGGWAAVDVEREAASCTAIFKSPEPESPGLQS